jgi:hypothetical protein
MEYRGYSEDELVCNRAALLLYGGTEDDRRAWALEVAGNFAGEGPLVEVHNLPELEAALQRSDGVVFVSAVLGVGLEGQAQILRCMHEREERPKLILGLSINPDQALSEGVLRDDLAYRLKPARVNLDDPVLLNAIRARRQRAEEALAAAKTLVPSGSRQAHPPSRLKRKPAPKRVSRAKLAAKRTSATKARKKSRKRR